MPSTYHAILCSGLRAVATGSNCKTKNARLCVRLLLSLLWVETFDLIGDWEWWTLGHLDMQDAVPYCFASRTYSNMHCKRRTSIPFVHAWAYKWLYSRFILEQWHFHHFPQLCNFCKYLNTCPASACTHIFTTYNLKGLFQGEKFHRFFFWCIFFNLSLWQNFPPSFHLPFQCVTYLSWNKLCNSVCLSTHSCYPWLICLYLYFDPPV